MKIRLCLLSIILCSFLSVIFFSAWADIPQMINYQGFVSVDGNAFDGVGQFKFAIINADESITYWSNDGTSTIGDEPTSAVQVNVTKGIYSVSLGDTNRNNMTQVDPSAFQNADVRLRIWFNDGLNGFQLLEPDQRFTAVSYAMVADRVTDGGITGNMIAYSTIDETKLNFTPLNLDTSSIYENSAGNIGIGTTNPFAALDVNGQIRIRNDNGLFFADNGYIGSKDDNHRILFRRPENIIELREYGDIIFSPGSTDGLETAKVVMKADGKMGVGTENPSAQLDVYTSVADPAIQAISDVSYGVAVLGENSLGGIGGKFVSTLTNTISVGLWAGSTIGHIIEGHEIDGYGDSHDLRFIVTSSGNVYADGTFRSPAADFAESVHPIGDKDEYEPGDVLIIAANSFSESHHYGFIKSHTPYSTRVAGVYSTKPGFIGGSQETDDLETGNNIPMAVVGIVPCKVSAENGPIETGDLLVSSSTPGHAMRGTDRLRMLGAIIGKALGKLDADFGIIDVLVTLQ